MAVGGNFYAEAKETFTQGSDGEDSTPVHDKSYINVWNAQTGIPVNGWEVQEETLRALDITPDGTLVAVAWGHRLKFWVPQTEEMLPQGPMADVDDVRLNPAGTKAYVLSNHDLEVYDVATANFLERHDIYLQDHDFGDLSMAADGSSLAIQYTRNGQKNVIRVYGLTTFAIEHDIDIDGRTIGGIALSPDKQQVMISAEGTGNNSDFVEVYRLSDAQRTARFNAVKSSRLAWIDNDHVTLSRNGTVYNYQVSTGQRTATIALQ